MSQEGNSKGENRKGDHKKIWTQLFLWGGDKLSLPKNSKASTQNSKAHTVSNANTRHIVPAEEDEQNASDISIKHILWSPWKIAAYIIFFLFLFLLIYLCKLIWTVEDTSDISGYKSDNKVRSVEDIIANANHKEISITEEEVNHYIKDSIFIRHNGPISILAKTQSIALRIHDGYGELIIDSSIGNAIPHSISIYLNFTREIVQGEPKIKLAFQGESSILNCIPIGGKCGQLPIPEKFIILSYPTLNEMLKQFPAMQKLIQEEDYLPIFSKRRLKDEGKIILLPEQSLQPE